MTSDALASRLDAFDSEVARRIALEKTTESEARQQANLKFAAEMKEAAAEREARFAAEMKELAGESQVKFAAEMKELQAEVNARIDEHEKKNRATREAVAILLSNDKKSSNEIKRMNLLADAQKAFGTALFTTSEEDAYKEYWNTLGLKTDASLADEASRIEALKQLIRNYTGSDKDQFLNLLDESEGSLEALKMLTTSSNPIWITGLNSVAHCDIYDRKTYIDALEQAHLGDSVDITDLERSALTVLVDLLHPVQS